jgi:predicted PilT family ATPase
MLGVVHELYLAQDELNIAQIDNEEIRHMIYKQGKTIKGYIEQINDLNHNLRMEKEVVASFKKENEHLRRIIKKNNHHIEAITRKFHCVASYTRRLIFDRGP